MSLMITWDYTEEKDVLYYEVFKKRLRFKCLYDLTSSLEVAAPNIFLHEIVFLEMAASLK